MKHSTHRASSRHGIERQPFANSPTHGQNCWHVVFICLYIAKPPVLHTLTSTSAEPTTRSHFTLPFFFSKCNRAVKLLGCLAITTKVHCSLTMLLTPLFPPIFNINTANTILLLLLLREHALIVDCCHSAPCFLGGYDCWSAQGCPPSSSLYSFGVSLAATGLLSQEPSLPQTPQNRSIAHTSKAV